MNTLHQDAMKITFIRDLTETERRGLLTLCTSLIDPWRVIDASESLLHKQLITWVYGPKGSCFIPTAYGWEIYRAIRLEWTDPLPFALQEQVLQELQYADDNLSDEDAEILTNAALGATLSGCQREDLDRLVHDGLLLRMHDRYRISLWGQSVQAIRTCAQALRASAPGDQTHASS